ncbi:MAG: carboxypeptidase regulatory-like domain-containing protein, partial [Candidatus Woesearchaeota archaeon]
MKRKFLLVLVVLFLVQVISVYAPCCMAPGVVKAFSGCITVARYGECGNLEQSGINQTVAETKQFYSTLQCTQFSSQQQLCWDSYMGDPPGVCCKDKPACTEVRFKAECQNRDEATFGPCPANCIPSTGAEFTLISGVIRDEQGSPLSNVKLAIDQTEVLSDQSGSYSFPQLVQGKLILRATKEGYAEHTQELFVTESIYHYDFVLNKLKARVKGFVKDQNQNPIDGATISINTVPSLSKKTDSSGFYKFEDVPIGIFSITASHPDYSSSQQALTIQALTDDKTVDFSLSPIPRGTFQGKVYLGDESQGKTTVIPISNAFVYVLDPVSNNYVQKAVTDSLGEFSITLDFLAGAQQTFQFKISKAKFITTQKSISLNKDQPNQATFYLMPEAGYCGYPRADPVSSFNAKHVPGEKAVELTWIYPAECTNIAGFKIYRKSVTGKYTDLAYLALYPGFTPSSYKDMSVNWGTSYDYQITVVYTDYVSRESEPTFKSIKTGDARCENRYIASKNVMSEFCEKNKRMQCSFENSVTSLADCGVNSVCIGPDMTGTTYCKADVCSSEKQNADPFGYFFDKKSCLGSLDPSIKGGNYCYFDYSQTPVDQCYSCSLIKDCFSYRSKEACLVDNCEVADMSTCGFVETASEIGKGICYKEGYKGTDKCNLCSFETGILGSIGCSQSVCSKLGKCWADVLQTKCLACDENIYCSAFSTQEACVGQTSPQLISAGNSLDLSCGKIIDNSNVCGIGVCNWIENVCRKDSDYNKVADCQPGELCEKNNVIPKINFTSLPLKAGKSSTFLIKAENNVAKIRYCIAKNNAFDCCPQSSDGKEIAFDGASPVNIPLYDPQITLDEGEYILKFYAIGPESSPGNRNQLSLFSYSLDPTPPQLDVIVTPDSYAKTISLKITANEPIKCSDKFVSTQKTLTPVLDNKTVESYFDVQQTKVPEGVYDLTLNCYDASGNTATFEMQDIIMDNFIKIISPVGPQSELSVVFKVNTSDPANCVLKKEESQISIFTSNEDKGREHNAPAQTLEKDKQYDNYYAECTLRSYALKISKKNFSFAIDHSPPETVVVFNKGTSNISGNKWNAFFDGEVSVDFACDLVFKSGYPCKKTEYCFVEGNIGDCTLEKEYKTTSLKFKPAKTYSLCYRSVDEGPIKNTEDKKCGFLHVADKIGIKLISPPNGVSKITKFDIVMQTLRPTTECGWATESNKNKPFSDTVAYKRFEALQDSTYRYRDFVLDPAGKDEASTIIYLKCKDPLNQINENSPTPVAIKYDISPPKIDLIKFHPNPVLETPDSLFIVEVDDPAVCKWDTKNVGFNEMKEFFAGYNTDYFKQQFKQNMSYKIKIDNYFDDLSKQQSKAFYVLCQNEAGDLSSLKSDTLVVDYSRAPNILSVLPSGYINYSLVSLKAITSRRALCKYGKNNATEATEEFDIVADDEKNHSTRAKQTSDGSYVHPLECKMEAETGSVTKKRNIDFSVDTKDPSLQINFSYACNPKEIIPSFVATDNSGIKEYEYSVLLGNETIISSTKTDKDRPKITVSLNQNKTYKLNAKVFDLAGNEGRDTQDFSLLSEEDPKCSEKDPPQISHTKDQLCNEATIELKCSDSGSGCAVVKYGVSQDPKLCFPLTEFTSTSPITLTQSSYICFEAEDASRNKASGNFFVNVSIGELSDSDSDGIPDCRDACPNKGGVVGSDGCSDALLDSDGDTISDDEDACPNTLSRYLATVLLEGPNKGCSPDEIDSDGDKLPDKFETTYEAKCNINMNNKDTDGEGIADDLEDCDNDGYTNYQEWLGGTDPTNADDYPGKISVGVSLDVDSDGDGIPDQWEIRYGLNPKDPNDANLDLDLDGFTNLEEYRAGTDPSDANDHPKKEGIFAAVVLAFGLLFISGGTGYLIYKKYFYKAPKKEEKPSLAIEIIKEKPKQMADTVTELLKRRKEILEKRRELRRKQKEELFKAFKGEAEVKKPEEIKEIKPKEEKPAKKVVYEPKTSKSRKEIFEKLSKLSKNVQKEKEFEKLAELAKKQLRKKPIPEEIKDYKSSIK